MPEPAKRIIKKVSGGHGHHGGAWKVAYADFVTAMMALFMVLWLLASTDAQTRKEISNYFRTGVMPDGDLAMNRAAQLKPALIEVSSMPPPKGEESFETEQQAQALAKQLGLLAATDPQLKKVMKGVHVEVTPEGILVEVVDQDGGLLFDVASSNLAEPLEHFLATMAPILGKLDQDIEINGHTDARPFHTGSRVNNWDLSYQRAAAARETLLRTGLSESKIRGVFARGASQLYVKDNPLAPQNRRLSILIKPAKTGDAATPPTTPIVIPTPDAPVPAPH